MKTDDGPTTSCTFHALSPTGGCLEIDLSGLPTTGFLVNDTSSYHDPYLIGSPCSASIAPCETFCSKQSCAACTSHSAAAYQVYGAWNHSGPVGSDPWCARCLDLGSSPTATCLRGGSDGGLRLTTHGGAGGRMLTYEFVCDTNADPDAGPEPGTGMGGVQDLSWNQYEVLWRTPHACAKPSPGPCPAGPPVPPPEKWWTCSPPGLNQPTNPKWNASYDMQRSTIVMPCNTSGPLDPQFFSQFGIVDIDWSHQKLQWANQQPMDSSGLMLKQAQALRKLNPNTRVWVYRNLVKALPWISAVREKLQDPQYQGWFLSYHDPTKHHPNAPPCDLHRANTTQRCSNRYHDQRETPEAASFCAKKDAPPSCDPTVSGNFVNGKPDPAQYCAEACDCGSIPCGEACLTQRRAACADDRWHLMNRYCVCSCAGGRVGPYS